MDKKSRKISVLIIFSPLIWYIILDVLEQVFAGISSTYYPLVISTIVGLLKFQEKNKKRPSIGRFLHYY